MKIALISPIAWRTPPRHYGPWESVVSMLAEGLVKRGIDVTLFATSDSITSAKLISVVSKGYEEDKSIEPKVWESLHIAEVFERASDFDLIHNNFDFLPLSYSRLVKTPVLTTIHGFSSKKILPVYQKYNDTSYYVSISNADRDPSLDYVATVYHGINLKDFTLQENTGDYLLFLGRIHKDKDPVSAVHIAKRFGMKLILAGIIQDKEYYEQELKPLLGEDAKYIGSVGPNERDKLLGGAYALLHPIFFEEPFGLSVVEAMATGTPVIAYNRGSMPELIKHGLNGFLVNNIDEAVSSLHDVPKLSRKRIRLDVERRFSMERMVDDYINVYKKILGGNFEG